MEVYILGFGVVCWIFGKILRGIVEIINNYIDKVIIVYCNWFMFLNYNFKNLKKIVNNLNREN